MLVAFALAAGAVQATEATTVNTVISVNQILCGINHTTSKRNVILLRQVVKAETETETRRRRKRANIRRQRYSKRKHYQIYFDCTIQFNSEVLI